MTNGYFWKMADSRSCVALTGVWNSRMSGDSAFFTALFLHRAIKSLPGMGLAKKNPWIFLQSQVFRNPSCSSVSTPSATVSRFRRLAK